MATGKGHNRKFISTAMFSAVPLSLSSSPFRLFLSFPSLSPLFLPPRSAPSTPAKRVGEALLAPQQETTILQQSDIPWAACTLKCTFWCVCRPKGAEGRCLQAANVVLFL